MTGRNFFAVINESAAYDPTLNEPDAEGNFELAPNYVIPSTYLKGANVVVIAPNAGTAGKVDVTIGGTYAIGDQVKLTIESNATSRQKFVKTYVLDIDSVLAAGTNNDIAEALLQKFKSELNAGLVDYPIASVSRVGAVVTITQKGDDKRGILAYEFTDSASGTIAVATTLTTISEGQPSDLVDKGISADDITLASYDTVKIELNIEVAQPFIDSKGTVVKELYWFGVVGKGANLSTAIAAL